MRLRMGFIVGLAVGYYLGAMAGRQRYEQLNRVLVKIGRSGVVDTATDKAKAVVDLGVERAKDSVQQRMHPTNEATDATVYSPS